MICVACMLCSFLIALKIRAFDVVKFFSDEFADGVRFTIESEGETLF
jgi:hypothetical protein